jgi:hypothetical protein
MPSGDPRPLMNLSCLGERGRGTWFVNGLFAVREKLRRRRYDGALKGAKVEHQILRLLATL